MTGSADKTAAETRRTGAWPNLHWLWLSAGVVLVDQLVKQLVVTQMTLYERIRIFDWLNLTLMHNTGAAFSMFTSAAPWFFIVLSVAVAVGIVIWMVRHPTDDRLFAAALALILGGALGNAIDRATRGFVADFVDFHIQGWHYPAFNVADSAIVIGALILALDMLWPRRGGRRPD